MKEQKKTTEKYLLLLDYYQNMYLVSVYEVVFYVVTIYRKKFNLASFNPDVIDEYNRIILEHNNLKALEALRKELKDYGVNISIHKSLDDEEFRAQRLRYIKYKFPDEDTYKFENSLRANFNNKVKTIFHYEPIILEINKQPKYYNNKLLMILYKQSLNWNTIDSILTKVAKRFHHYNVHYFPNKINRYNRIFYYDTNEDNINKVREELTKKEINTLVLDNEEEFIIYRLQYIKHYYPEMSSSFLHAKWRLEYENGWFNKERWDPIIYIPKQKKKASKSNNKMKK